MSQFHVLLTRAGQRLKNIVYRLPRQNMVDEGYAATQILSQLHESVIEQDLSDKQKSAITEKMAVSAASGAAAVWFCFLLMLSLIADKSFFMTSLSKPEQEVSMRLIPVRALLISSI